jgi:hypothetical protein
MYWLRFRTVMDVVKGICFCWGRAVDSAGNTARQIASRWQSVEWRALDVILCAVLRLLTGLPMVLTS